MSRTVVNLRDDLVVRAQRLSRIKKKVEIVNFVIEELVSQRKIHKAIMEMEGRVKWEGDLKAMRRDRKIDFSR